MFEVLTGFASLSILAGTLTALLPEGSLRKTACMAVGLLMLMYWYSGLQSMGNLLPVFSAKPTSVLSPTGITLPTPLPEDTP